MTVDELMVKLKIDQSQVDPELQSFLGKVRNAMEGTHKSFLHVESAGRSFHKVLEGLSEQSPMLGTALRMALNPVTGLLLGALLVLKKFVETQKQAVEQAEKLGKASATQHVGMLEARYAEDPQAVRKAQALADAKANALKSNNEFLKDAEQEIVKSGQFTEAELGTWGFRSSKPFLDMVTNRANEMRETATQRYESLLAEQKPKKDAKEIADIKTRIAREELESQRAAMDAQQKLISLEEEKLKLKREIESTDKEDVDLWRKRQDLARLEHETAQVSKQAAKEKAEADKKDLDVKQAIARLEEQMRDSRQMMTARQFAEYQPTIEELASSPIAWRFNPMAARQARYVEWLQRGAHFQELAGNVAGARETVFGKGGVNELRKQLEGTGLIKPELSLERIQKHLQSLDEKASRGDFLVSIENLD